MAEQEIPVHKPYVPSTTILPELTPLPLLVGTILGIVFGAASLYLALKIGLTISASIPIAVMSISIFKWIARVFKTRQATILENNIVQTTGSAGESIAFGVAVTMPALLILGQDMDVSRIVTVAVLGGLLGILMMIPLRRGLIVKEHGKLAYPEGTACAEVLIAGEKGGTNAKTVFTGFGVGFLYKLLNGEGGFTLFKNTPEWILSWFKGGSVAAEVSPELLGVGYIIGPEIAGIMCAGGVLAYLVLIPAIKIFGDGLAEPLFPATVLIRDMSPHDVRNAYILYIGAGAVAAGGIISLLRVIPTIVGAFAAGVKNLMAGQEGKAETPERVDHDLPMSFVIGGCVALVAALLVVRSLELTFITAPLILIFGFLFVTVSSRLTGTIGSSSNPISGMTVATLLLTCLIFLAFGATAPHDRIAALSIAAVVCIASSNGGTTSQDLKTGFLIGGTPRAQQIGILVGALTSALVIGFTLKLFNDTKTVYAWQNVEYRVPADQIGKTTETLKGNELARDTASGGTGTYHAVHYTGESAPRAANGAYLVQPGKYLVEENGAVRWLVDPGINGRTDRRDPSYTPVKSGAVDPRMIAAATTSTAATTSAGVAGFKLVEYTDKTVPLDAAGAAIAEPGRYLVDGAGKISARWLGMSKLHSPEARKDPATYAVLGFDKSDAPGGVLPGVYYAEAASGRLVYGEQPGTSVPKFDAPKARLMSLIIDGILTRKLPWGLVLLGVFIALTLELSGISSLPFAVGVYLPISASTPIWIGGLVRWVVDRKSAKRSDAENESSPGVLLSSGLIAGGAIGGMVLAILVGAAENFSNSINVSKALGAFATSDAVALLIFLALGTFVYLVGREKLLAPKK